MRAGLERQELRRGTDGSDPCQGLCCRYTKLIQISACEGRLNVEIRAPVRGRAHYRRKSNLYARYRIRNRRRQGRLFQPLRIFLVILPVLSIASLLLTSSQRLLYHIHMLPLQSYCPCRQYSSHLHNTVICALATLHNCLRRNGLLYSQGESHAGPSVG